MKSKNYLNHFKRLYVKKTILIVIVLLLACTWGVIFQSHRVPAEPDPLTSSWISYFINNMKQCAYIIIVGFLTYGFGSLIILALNGVLIGIVLEMIVQNKISYAIFTGFLPHGIFEIPAILIACLYPFFIWRFLGFLFKKKKMDTFIVKEVLITPVIISFLLVIAGIIESTVSVNF